MKITDAFLADLRSITTLDATHDGNGFSGSLKFHCDVQELMSRHPEVTSDQIRRASLVVLKEYMKEEREKWYAKLYAERTRRKQRSGRRRSDTKEESFWICPVRIVCIFLIVVAHYISCLCLGKKYEYFGDRPWLDWFD